MSGIQELREEHRSIRDVLGVLERAVNQASPMSQVQMEDALHCVEFLEEFGVRWHEARDEQLLFPWLSKHRPDLAPTISTLIREHESMREDLRRLESWIREARRGEPHAHGTSRRIAHQLVKDLNGHLRREEQLIYDVAILLPSEARDELMSAMDAFERSGRRFEVRDRYVEMAQRLTAGRPAVAEEAHHGAH